MSKFCTNCGLELSNDASFCGNCGLKVTNEPKELVNNVVHKENSMAVAGFVLSIISIILYFIAIPEILGLIFSIIGLKNTKQTGVSKKGLAIAGIVISSIMLVTFAIFLLSFIIGILVYTI